MDDIEFREVIQDAHQRINRLSCLELPPDAKIDLLNLKLFVHSLESMKITEDVNHGA